MMTIKIKKVAWDKLPATNSAVPNLRIRWIRFFAELESSARPAVVQLLGRGDRLVSRNDSLDVEQFSQAWQSGLAPVRAGGRHAASIIS
jgi:hypothetical protein